MDPFVRTSAGEILTADMLTAVATLHGPPHGFGIGNPRKYVDVDPQSYSNEISQKKSRIAFAHFFIFFKKLHRLPGLLKKTKFKNFARVKS